VRHVRNGVRGLRAGFESSEPPTSGCGTEATDRCRRARASPRGSARCAPSERTRQTRSSFPPLDRREVDVRAHGQELKNPPRQASRSCRNGLPERHHRSSCRDKCLWYAVSRGARARARRRVRLPSASASGWSVQTDRRKPRTSALKRSGASTWLKWPAPGITTSRDPGIRVRRSSATDSGERTS
jgi:hypothetical protein